MVIHYAEHSAVSDVILIEDLDHRSGTDVPDVRNQQIQLISRPIKTLIENRFDRLIDLCMDRTELFHIDRRNRTIFRRYLLVLYCRFDQFFHNRTTDPIEVSVREVDPFHMWITFSDEIHHCQLFHRLHLLLFYFDDIVF